MSQNQQNPRLQTGKPIEASVQAYLEISEARDNILIMKDGSLRAVLMISSINFELKSPQEQEAIVGAYQDFLNSLNFPIQILMRSKNLQLDNYLKKVNQRIFQENSPFIKNQIEQYLNFIREMLDVAKIMDKKFYIVVPFYPSAIDITKKKVGFVQKIGSALNPTWSEKIKTDELEIQKNQLLERVELVVSNIGNMGLVSAMLNTAELIELFYEVYNPETSQREKISDTGEITTNIVKGE